MRVHAVVLGLCVIAAAAAPATALTLEATIAEALRSNPELRSLEARLETLRRQAVVAGKYIFNPELEFEEGLDRRFGVGQTIEWPGKRALRRAIARQDVAAAEAALAAFRVSLAAETAARFFDLLAARKAVELHLREVKVAEHVLEIARRRVAGAFAPATERSTAEVGLVRAQRDVREAQKGVEQARVGVASLLGSDAGALFEADGELSAPRFDVSADRAGAVALERNPDLQLALHEVEKKRLGAVLAWRERIPDFTVGPFYEIDTTNPDDRKAGVGLRVPLPLWNTGAANVAAAQAEEREAEAAVAKIRRDVLTQVAKAYSAFVAAADELRLYSPPLLAELDAQVTETERRYESGQLPFVVLLETRRSYFAHLKDYYEALAAARAAEAEIEKAATARIEELR